MRAVHVNPTIEITMIGHSKGGAEAANSVAINTNAIIFNSATVNLSAYELDTSTYIYQIWLHMLSKEMH
ncbi:hypothetical protein Q3F32_00485 [Enterococcus faecium]|nr:MULTISPECIES: hypothetical protein [Enterococcus]EEV47369.1 conserved hypothetical protein [Enterococcus faecium 1,231,501]MDQ8398321.1 hypothetical protein [Enterococcus faecium]MDT6385002.1 hypothetical protein [Enterococcus faecium]